jgi:hypothetical protein
MSRYRITGLVLIALPIAFNLVFFALGSSFEYPDILRMPTPYILERFAEGGTPLVTLWYLFAMTALLAIPMALLFKQVFVQQAPELASASAIVGVLSGLVQALGLFRWTFLVPSLSAQYNAPGASETSREAVAVVFNAFHQYAGVAVGEHMGYMFTGAWTILISVMMFRSARFGRLMGIFGIIAAVGIMVGLLEPAGVSAAGAVNAISYIVWSLWLIVSGVILLRAQPMEA